MSKCSDDIEAQVQLKDYRTKHEDYQFTEQREGQMQYKERDLDNIQDCDYRKLCHIIWYKGIG